MGMFPTIADAKSLSVKYRKRGVIILSFSADGIASASYGMTRADCSAMKDVSEQVVDELSGGVIELPDGFSEALQSDAAGYGSGGELALARLALRFMGGGCDEAELRKACERVIGPVTA